jgi:hypothetical protein
MTITGCDKCNKPSSHISLNHCVYQTHYDRCDHDNYTIVQSYNAEYCPGYCKKGGNMYGFMCATCNVRYIDEGKPIKGTIHVL